MYIYIYISYTYHTHTLSFTYYFRYTYLYVYVMYYYYYHCCHYCGPALDKNSHVSSTAQRPHAAQTWQAARLRNLHNERGVQAQQSGHTRLILA